MGFFDRVGRSLFVALAVGLAWGIRGDFGHLVGAMYPGAALGLGLAYVTRQRSMFLWMPILGAVAGIAIGSGGSMSYGILHGYAKSDTLINYSYGFLTLFLQGSAWGTFGGCLIGLLLERKPLRTGEWLGLLATILAAGWFTSFLVVDVIGFHINPPRSDSSIGFMGAALGQLAWLIVNRKSSGLRGAVLGYVGFGLGMAAGRLLGNLSTVLQEPLGFTINTWNVMEVSCGFIGGFIFCFGMLDRAYPEPPEDENISYLSVLSMIYVLGVIPLWHRLNRIDPSEKLDQWSAALKSYGYDDPEGLAQTVLWLLNGVCALGVVGALVWMVIYLLRRERLAALPVLWLSITMILFQNLNALYFFYPREKGRINMHSVFWVMFALMAVYAVLARNRPLQEPEPADDDMAEPLWGSLGWLGAAVVALALVVVAAGYVNGPETMQSANTRWPQWNWRDGPFPGNEATP